MVKRRTRKHNRKVYWGGGETTVQPLPPPEAVPLPPPAAVSPPPAAVSPPESTEPIPIEPGTQTGGRRRRHSRKSKKSKKSRKSRRHRKN
jgi:hypothetical protein